MKKLVVSAAIGVLLAAPVAPAAAQGWQPVECELSHGHYLVNSALLYLRNAARTRFQDQRDRDLADALRVLSQALDQGRDNDPAVWYFLGRYYAATQDLAGADSAWDRAATMVPDCVEDINGHRRRLWVPILNRGVDALRAGDMEAAKRAFLTANEIYEGEPPAFYSLGQIYANASVSDSAVAAFTKAIELANNEANVGSEQYADIRENAAFNIARLYHRDTNYDSAVVWYQRYRVGAPDDPQAITGQASALASAGRDDEAVALYDSVLQRADDMPTVDLFATGVALFRAGQYEQAAQAFERGLERSPNYRDALFNLANTYLRMSDADSGLTDAERDAADLAHGERMFPVTQRLTTVDPSSSAAKRLLAAAYQLRGLEDSTLAVLEQVQAMTFDVTVSVFQATGSGGFEIRGLILNVGADAVTVPAITFEFVNEAGEVLQTYEIPEQVLDAEGGTPFGARVDAEGIAAWRYRIAS